MKSAPRAMQICLKAMTTVAFLAAVSGSVWAQKTAVSPKKPKQQTLLESGDQAFANGQFDEALSAFNQVLALVVTDRKATALAHIRIGSVYMAQREYEHSLTSFRQAAAADPGSAEAQNGIGEALGEMRQYDRALQAFNKATSLDRALLRARYNTGITYDRLGNLKYSEFVFRMLVRDHPEYDLGYDGLAVSLSKSGRAREALSFHKKAISLNPNEPSFYYNLALSYLILGETGNAFEQQQKLKTLAPEVAERLASAIVKHQMR